MNIPFPSKVILKPSLISMVAVSASFAAWLFPSFGAIRKGFDNPAQLDFSSFSMLSCWYLLIFLSFYSGEKLGQLWTWSKTNPLEGLLDLDANFLYYTFTLVSAIGTAATLFRILRVLSWQETIVFVALGQANALKDALYEDYSIGLVSVRYLVLYSASIALYRMIRWRSFSAINLCNMLLLAVSTFILGSRLIFMATLLTTILLLTLHRNVVRISLLKTIVLGAVCFLILGVANILRNNQFYETNHLSFAQAGISEIVAYLGSPFQVAIGSVPVMDKLIKGPDETYRDLVDVEEELNSNSAFVHLHEVMGYFSWAYIAILCLFMGFVFEFLRSLGQTAFLLPCGAILYASAELWRLDLFQQGIFVVWMVTGIGLPVFLLAGQRFFRFLGGTEGIGVRE